MSRFVAAGDTAAVATESGQILVFDLTVPKAIGNISFYANKLAITSDGSVLAAADLAAGTARFSMTLLDSGVEKRKHQKGDSKAIVQESDKVNTSSRPRQTPPYDTRGKDSWPSHQRARTRIHSG
jgi:hypothetical protein